MNDPDPQSLTMVVAPASDHAGGLDLKGLVEFLSERSGIPIDLVRCKNYETAIKALQEGTAELGWLGPYAYQEASLRGNVESFAVGLRKGNNTLNYQSVFITASDSPIKDLAQTKNKRLAIGDPHSTSGYIVPKRALRDVGINLENESEFEDILHAANHDQAIRFVLDGTADIAPVSSINLDESIEKGVVNPNQIRIVHRSKDIPGAPLVYRTDLPAATKRLLKDLVLSAHEFISIGGYGGEMEKYVDPAEGRHQFLQSYLRSQWGWRTWVSLGALVVITALTLIDLEVDPASLTTNMWSYLVDIFGRMLPPNFSELDTLLLSMLETVEIAFLGTLLAITISIPIGLFSARNIAPSYPVYIVARFITVFFRAIPEFIMAMILVIAIGFGAMPGVIALGLHTMGFLAKFYAEDMEHVNTTPVDALGSMGANRLQVLAFAVIPQVIPSFVGNNLYIFDRNIRMATMLGIVGAGGIGYELQSSFRSFEYPRVAAIIIVIFVTILLIDMLSSYLRSKVL